MNSIAVKQKLIDRAQEGDTRAVGRLYDDLFPGIYGFARMRLPTVQDTEDIVSETFLTMVKQLPGFEWKHRGGFEAWVFRILRSKISNFYRANGSQTEQVEEARETRTNENSRIDVEGVVILGELRASLIDAIKSLQPRQEEVILLRYFGGLRNKDIAEVLGIEERTVSAHLSRGLNLLHDRVQNKGLKEAS
ncbi:MAG: RNA polymerase sigma factor [Anaerolineales bacterium]|jgi:RNA polymerase sigma-70 factor (ECF subfamily)